jgi:transposase
VRCLVRSRRSSGRRLWSWPVSGVKPLREIARDLGIAESCLRPWMNQADVDVGRKEGLTTAEWAELVELRRKLRVAEMENEILKRAAAYFAKENVLPK